MLQQPVTDPAVIGALACDADAPLSAAIPR
jgi:hypothetical protein